MPTRFSHIAIVAHDPDRLAEFYIEVFGCERSGPPRDLFGEPLEAGMGLPGAHVRGVHLRLPGHGDPGPVLEIFALDATVRSPPDVNRLGLSHVAFSVDDIHATYERLLACGGTPHGTIAEVTVAGVGTAEFVYSRDPEGNFVELQGWK